MNNGIQSYMNSINDNMNRYKNSINKGTEINKINNNKTNQPNTTKTAISDTIEISQKNELVINTKKANEAFRETCAEIGETKWNGYLSGDMSGDFLTICDMMKYAGYKVPNIFTNADIQDLANNDDYLGFLDQVDNFIKSDPQLSVNHPTKFFDFTKLFREKLLLKDCK